MAAHRIDSLTRMNFTVWCLLMLSAVDAPVTQVTVFSDAARVTRTARVSGDKTIEFPTLPDTVDVASIRVEGTGAQVQRVDIARLAEEKARPEALKELMAEIDTVDSELSRTNLDIAALNGHGEVVANLAPQMPTSDGVKPFAKLNPVGWLRSAEFVQAELAAVQKRLEKAAAQQKALREKRVALAKKANSLGAHNFKQGWKVTATVAGSGEGRLQLTYLVRNATWVPQWDVHFQPDNGTVSVSLAGSVSQSTGEDWERADLNLSTAVPLNAVEAPKLLTWKIGVSDRFIPTPQPRAERLLAAPRSPAERRNQDLDSLTLSQLLNLARTAEASPQSPAIALRPPPPVSMRARAPAEPEPGGIAHGSEVFGRTEVGEGGGGSADDVIGAPMPVEVRAPAAPKADQYELDSSPQSAPESVRVTASTRSASRSFQSAPTPTQTMSLTPPRGWQPPAYAPTSAVALANGYDLLFPSMQKESIPSASAQRRVALWADTWPIKVERKIYPALSADAFLVAELKKPSKQVLPGGQAQLFVGADPSGVASLKLVSPGEAFTLPLGLDKNVRPVRNVKLVEQTDGLISKEETGTYTVTIEVANPYPVSIAARVFDQYPVAKGSGIEVKLLESKPVATQDTRTGELTWQLTLPPKTKTTVSFVYSIRRPKGHKLFQEEVAK
jgi:Domain of unknown function (DUF4139)/N-terminal domain of unknown function (DUF4140)